MHILKISITIILVISFLAVSTSSQNTTCIDYLIDLKKLYDNSRNEFFQQLAPFLLFSGKNVDDLGFPQQCNESKEKKYFVAQFQTNYDDNWIEGYYGLCFNQKCSITDLNTQGIDLIKQLLDNFEIKAQSIQFHEGKFEKDTTVWAIFGYIIFSLIIIFSMIYSILIWLKQCIEKPEQEVLQDYSYHYSIKLEDDYEPIIIQQTILEKYSLQLKFQELLESGKFPAQSQQKVKRLQNKYVKIGQTIKSFDLFKLIAIPWIICGEIFYLWNLGSYNYFSMDADIYHKFWANFSLAAYYLPDIFFFISSYLFMKKALKLYEKGQNPTKILVQGIMKKILRLYPIYIAVIIVYWWISPTLHIGPVWYVYQHQVGYCDKNWWASLLLIGNMFSQSCYTPGWFVQVQLQYVLFSTLFLFLFFINKRIAKILLFLMTIASYVFLLVLSAALPTTIKTTTSTQTKQYFTSTYSHLPFYFTGIMVAILSQRTTICQFVQQYLIGMKIIRLPSIFISLAILSLVILHPSVWQNALSFELGLCRLGIFFSFFILFMKEMFGKRAQGYSPMNRLHKLAKHSYPIILVSGIIIMCKFWSLNTFPYASGSDLLQSLIPNLVISIFVGVLLGMLLTPRRDKYKW